MTSNGPTIPEPLGEPSGGTSPTWEEFAAEADNARQAALALGRLHGERLRELNAFGDANGGGLLGLGRGVLRLRAQQQLITETDRDRLIAMMEYVLGVEPDANPGAVVSQVQAMHQQIADDPASTLPALAVSAIALDSVMQNAVTHSDTFASVAATAVADLVGSGFGIVGGPIGALGLAYTVSGITMTLT